jgi:chemotaxis protein CheC
VNLAARQEDALKELINIGYGRAAAALSELTGARVVLDAPQLSIFRIGEVGNELNRHFSAGVTAVNQMFSGPITGNALLLLDESSAWRLAALVSKESTPGDVTDTIAEIGNIILSASLGVFGNLLQIQISFTLPDIQVTKVDQLLRSIVVDREHLTHALLVRTRFGVRNSNVKGYLGLILGVSSIDRLLGAIEEWSDA